MAGRLGLRARDFTRGLFQLKTSPQEEPPFDDDLFRTITAGVPASGMPPFHDLTARERWALVACVKALARIEPAAARTRIVAPAVRGDAARGAALYGPACSPCHGSDGAGKGPASGGLEIQPPDLARGEVVFKGGSGPADLFRGLTTGLAGTPMPSFASLPGRDRADLAAFVSTLYRPVPRGERLFLTAGCMTCHTLGKGRLIGPDLLGVARRRDRAWLRRWLSDPSALIATDKEARRLAREYGSPMPDPGLTAAEIEQVLDYLASRR